MAASIANIIHRGVIGVSTLIMAVVLFSVLSQGAHAQKTIRLTAIDGYPPRAAWVREFINFYIPEVDKRLAKSGNYKIRWNQAWAGQIVKPKHVLEGLQKGLGDIGVVTTVFHPDKVPLQAIAYVTPFVTTDPELVARTVDELADKFPAFKNAWKRYNQVYLTNLVVLDTYQLFAKRRIADLADLKGMKIAGAGVNLRYLHGLGVAGVGGSLVGYYNKLKTGVVDAAMIWPEAAVTFKIVEVAPHMLDARIGTVNSKAINVNTRTWKRLPGEVKKVLAEAAIDYRNHMARVAVTKGRSSYMKYQQMGGSVVRMSDRDRDHWAKIMPNIAKSWAAGLDKKGLPGTEVLRYYMDTMRRNGQKISRHWDRE